MPISLVPFSGGLNTHVDVRLLPDGALQDVTNAEMDRSGRLVGRAKFSAQAATVYDSGTLTAFDLFQMNDRLFAFGDAQSYGYPSDVFEYCPTGAAAQWRPTSTENEATPRLPRATAVRDMCRPPDQAEGITNMGCAATVGYACLVWNISDNANLGFVHVVSAAKNQPLLFQRLEDNTGPLVKMRVVGLSDRFILLGLNAATTAINTARFIPASSEVVANLAADIMPSGGAITVYAVCKVDGSDEFMVVANLNGTVTTRRYNASGVLQVPSGGQYSTQAVVPTALAVEASSTADQVNIAMVVSGEARIFSYNLSTGAEIGTGPHVPFTGETSVEVSLVRVSSTVIQIVSSVTSETAPTIFTRRYTVSTNTFATSRKAVTDAQLTTSAVFSTDTVFGMRYGLATVGNTPNMLVSSGDGTEHVTPLVAKDLEVCETVSSLLPDICRDSSTGKFYWANSVANPDGSSIPQLTEFMLTSTARRQTAQLGNLVYIGGGTPCVFDGLNLSESGFQERPRIISLTPSNSTGQLLSGGTYKYRLHWEWIDSDGNLHLSPPSTISEVELGNTDDTVTAVVSTPHSLRRNVGNPTGTVACVLSRTLGTVTRTAPSFTGSFVVDPPYASLDGLVLNLYIDDDTGGTMFTITFDAGSITAAAIVIDINAVTTGRITASNEGGAIKLTADDSGEGIFLTVAGTSGDAAEILGLPNQSTKEGTTVYTVGENFQRSCVGYTGTAGAVAAYKTLTDITKDQSDPIVDTDLIRQQVLYSQGVASGAHHAPPPAEYVWAGRERVLVAGQPKRSRWTVSKTLVPAEPAEFAFEGFLGYSNTVTGDIEACAVMGDALIFWTRHQIWQVTGSGPNRAGQGEFFAPQCISKAGGLVADGWRSLVETDDGIWFQRASDQLCVLTRSGQVEWRGMEVQDKLQLYPVVVAGCYCSTKHSVVFAVQASNGLTGGLLRFDLDAKVWFFDDVGAVSALTTYQGRLVYVQAGVVYIQDASPGAGAFVSYSVTTGMFQGFQVLGYGQLNQIGILGTFRGDCTVTISLSVNGTTFSTLDTFSLTTSEYSVGQRVQLMKAPATMNYDSFAVKVAITGTTDSEGLWLHALALDTETQPDLVRKGPAHTK
jgi:hypothetical protein